MSERIPQSVAVRVAFKAYLASDGGTEATGKTIAITISKNGAAFTNPNGTPTNATEIANGWYYVDLVAADVGTLGPLALRGTAATIDDVGQSFRVVSANNAGFVGVPDVAAGANGGLPTGDASGKVTLVSAYDFAKGTVAMAESYAANGVAPTPIQALFALHQKQFSFTITGTSLAVQKLDNVTVAFTATLNSATTPTGIIR